MDGLLVALEYAGIDLLKPGRLRQFSIENNLIKVYSLLGGMSCVPGIPSWDCEFQAGRNIPREGKIKLSGANFYAKGTACIRDSIIVEDFGILNSELAIFKYHLVPMNAPLVFPEEDRKRAADKIAREQLQKHQELERQRKLAAWKDVGGIWTVTGVEYGNPKSETYDSMSEAIISAAVAVEWNYWCPESIWQNDRLIFVHDDISALLDYSED